jgi:hypothetical protein
MPPAHTKKSFNVLCRRHLPTSTAAASILSGLAAYPNTAMEHLAACQRTGSSRRFSPFFELIAIQHSFPIPVIYSNNYVVRRKARTTRVIHSNVGYTDRLVEERNLLVNGDCIIGRVVDVIIVRVAILLKRGVGADRKYHLVEISRNNTHQKSNNKQSFPCID